MKRTRPGLTVSVSTTVHRDNTLSPHGLPSSIPTISSLASNDDRTPVYRTNFAKSTAQSSSYLDYSEPYVSRHLSAVPESASDQASVYSDDSACVIYSPKPRAVANATPKTALTFAAIWDPERGFTTVSGSELLTKEIDDSALSPYDSEEYDDLFENGHPDCEPHLPSRFSTTTTSTSNYIDIDFSEEDHANSLPTKDTTMASNLRPGDVHPPWIPQIFNVGYTKLHSSPSTPESERPAISEPFQLTSPSAFMIRRPTLSRASSRHSSKSPKSSASPTVKRKQSSTSTAPSVLPPRIPTPPPLYRQYTSNSEHSYLAATPPPPPPPQYESPSADANPIEFPVPRSSTPSPTSAKRTRLPSVWEKLKRTGSQDRDDSWVYIDITPSMRVVRLQTS